MARTELASRLAAHLAQTGLVEGPATAVLAVSGGADSMALLSLFAELAEERGLTLVVAHADHGILDASASTAAMVREVTGGRFGLPVSIASLGLGAGATETRARAARYSFLREVQRESGARFLLTAHHADDQAETVLLRLLRGSATAGLAGIPERGPRGLVRPLLPFGRAELLAHALQAGLPYYEDPSNADPRHTRAWVRHRILPIIEQRLGSEGREALAGVARHARTEIAAWDQLLDVLPGLEAVHREGHCEVARGPLRDYDNALAGRILRALARRAGLRLGPAAAARAAVFARGAASGRRLDLGEGLVAEAAFDRLVIGGGVVGPAPVSLEGAAGSAEFGQYRVSWRREKLESELKRASWTTWADDAGALEFRCLLAGDRLLPLGGVGHRPVRRLLMEAKVPRGARAGYPLLVRDGQVLWVPGICRAGAGLPPTGTMGVRLDVSIR